MNKEVRTARARAGGLARGWQERKAALERYNLNPHLCHYCGGPIEVGNRRIADVIKKKFCGYSHAAKFRIAHGGLTSSLSPA